MYKLWAKKYLNHKVIEDLVLDLDIITLATKENAVKDRLEEISYALDLARPIWMRSHSKQLRNHNTVVFKQEHFVEEVAFDYIELEIFEED